MDVVSQAAFDNFQMMNQYKLKNLEEQLIKTRNHLQDEIEQRSRKENELDELKNRFERLLIQLKPLLTTQELRKLGVKPHA